MYRHEELAPLVDQVYEAMLDDAQWPRALTSIAHSLRGRLPVLYHHDTRNHAGGMSITVGYDSAAVQAYGNYYAERNVWLRTGEELLKTRRTRTSHMMCPRRELVRSEFYNGFLVRMIDTSQAIGATLLRQGTHSSNITLFAGPERSEFSQDDVLFLDALVPHLRRALQVHMRMAEGALRKRELLETLAGLSVGIFLVSAHGKVLFMNAAAGSFVAKGGALAIDAAGLRAIRSDDTAKLRALIGGAAQTSRRRALSSGGVLRVAQPKGGSPLEVLVSPIHVGGSWSWGERSVAAVYVTDPGRSTLASVGTIRALYGLTATEARVFSALSRGVSGKRAAEELGISYNTLKTHLRHIFMKTDTRSQVELLRLAHRGVAGIGSGESDYDDASRRA